MSLDTQGYVVFGVDYILLFLRCLLQANKVDAASYPKIDHELSRCCFLGLGSMLLYIGSKCSPGVD